KLLRLENEDFENDVETNKVDQNKRPYHQHQELISERSESEEKEKMKKVNLESPDKEAMEENFTFGKTRLSYCSSHCLLAIGTFFSEGRIAEKVVVKKKKLKNY
ncbi:44869_t:CDS:2, partial [Gigaspora margarita]